MCTYSNIGDHSSDPNQWPWKPVQPNFGPSIIPTFPDFAQLQRDAVVADLKTRVEALEKLLAAAKKYDADTGQPDCELEAKKKVLRSIAKDLGVEINLP